MWLFLRQRLATRVTFAIYRFSIHLRNVYLFASEDAPSFKVGVRQIQRACKYFEHPFLNIPTKQKSASRSLLVEMAIHVEAVLVQADPGRIIQIQSS